MVYKQIYVSVSGEQMYVSVHHLGLCIHSKSSMTSSSATEITQLRLHFIVMVSPQLDELPSVGSE